MRGKAITLAKREPNPLCEDSSRIVLARNKLLAVSDGAGGGGLYADKWSKYLMDNLTADKEIEDAEGLDTWISHIWEPFYKKYELEAQKMSPWHINKFYDEGSFATLVAIWGRKKNMYNWIAYGDSVAFHYSKKNKKLYYSIDHLKDFANAPYLINCKDELKLDGFRKGSFDVDKGDYVFVASDALSHYIIMMYAVLNREKYQKELDGVIALGLRSASYINQALSTTKKDFFKEILKPLILASYNNKSFAKYIDTLLRNSLIAADDYSIVWYRI